MLNNLFRIHVKFHELLRIFLHFIIQIINLSIYISSIIIITLFFHISHKLPNSLTAKEITRQLNNYHAQIVTRNKSSQSTIKTFSLSSTNTNISKRHSRTPLLRRNVESIRRHRWILFSKNHKLLAKYLPLSRAVFYDVVRSFRDI